MANMLNTDEKKYLLDILQGQRKKIKNMEKVPDDYFQQFAGEVSIDEFLTGLIEKVKKL